MGNTWASDSENEDGEQYIRSPKEARTDSGLVGGSTDVSSAQKIETLNKSPSLYSFVFANQM